MKEFKNYDVGKRIKELRKAQRLSQEEVAYRSKITQTYLGSIERNTRNPSVKVLENIIRSLDVSFTEFFSNAQPHRSRSELLDERIIDQLENYQSEEDKLFVINLLKNIHEYKN